MKILLTCLLAFVGLTLYGQPVTPFLTIETGMHKARISQTSADASGRYILTGSEDKTARLWDAETGVLLNTLRIPVAPGDEGKVAACALSPDGKIAALGGITGYEWDEKFSIYLVSTQTNEIIFRIKNIPGPISDLEFSPDGKCLASVNSDSNLEIYDTRNWLLSSTVKGVSGISFDITNRIAAFSIIDKTVKLFDSKLKLIAETTVDYMPWAVSFSADNKLLAISSYNYPIAVEVRNAYDLSLLYKPNTDNNFASIGTAFDKTSNKLYAWGSSGEANLVRRGEGAPVLRIWENNGQGSYTDITISENFTFLENAITLPGGKMVVLNNGEIVVINSTGKIFWHSTGNLSYGYGSQDHFRINNTGTGIGFTPDFEPSFTFNVLKRQLLQEQSLSPPFSDNNNITKITSWNSRIEGGPPVINQVPANFVNETNEAIRAVDINQDGREVVLAGFYYLIKADNKANPIWGSPLPYVSLAVNISGDDKMVACLIGDGTIRWYSMKDGETLLTFYLHPDKKRWVLFTPFGYYDASPGAEDFLGWHLNNGPDKTPDFYPVSRFKEQFYRPDVIDAIFETYNEEQAITLADSRSTKKILAQAQEIRQKLPPTVTISSPSNGTTISNNTVSLTYSVNSPTDAPAKNLRVLINGRPAATERGLKPAAPGQKITVTVPSEDCTITLLADNDNGTSPEANLYLKWAAPAIVKEEFIYKPKLYVLAIGVSDYNNPELKLGFAAKDAGDFASTIALQKGTLYSDVIVKKLTNKEANKDAILDGLEWIQKQTSQKDLAMIFYAGHGINDNNGVFYMLPVAADLERIKATCLNFEELKQTVSSIAGKVVVFIDACHSGNVMGTRRGGTDINALVNELSSTENGAITFTSSTGKEFSLEDPKWGNGAFTKAVIEGLKGKAAIPGKNKITIKSLDAYISERVKELTQGKQHPTSVTPPNVPDFPIGVIR